MDDVAVKTWVVYGRVKTGVDEVGQVVIQGLHRQSVPLDEANAYIEDAITKHGAGAVDAVLVELKYGLDRHGERRVIRRLNDFKSWWE
jgi:hypothetical protein